MVTIKMPLKQLRLNYNNNKWDLTPEARWEMLPDDLVYIILMYYKKSLYKGLLELDAAIKITAKGIKKSIAKTELTLQHFKDTLFGVSEAPKVKIPSLVQSNKNGIPQVFMQDRAKKSLSRYDDKRFILPDGIETRAHGHYLNK